MLTEKDYCDKDLSLALKEAGYIGQGRCYYDLDKEPNKLRHFGIQVLTTRSAEALNFVLAVHLYDAQKFLREEKQMILLPAYLGGANVWICEICYKRERLGFGGYNQSYEEALSEGLRASIKILQDEQKENN